MNDFLEALVQVSTARLLRTSNSRLATSLVTSTSTAEPVASTLVRLGEAVFSSAPMTWKLVMGSKVNFPVPAVAKSKRDATRRRYKISRFNRNIEWREERAFVVNSHSLASANRRECRVVEIRQRNLQLPSDKENGT